MSLVGTVDAIDTDFQRVPIMYVPLLNLFVSPKTTYGLIRDLSHIRSDDPAKRKKLADEVRDACMHVGFFYGLFHFSSFCVHFILLTVLNSEESWNSR